MWANRLIRAAATIQSVFSLSIGLDFWPFCAHQTGLTEQTGEVTSLLRENHLRKLSHAAVCLVSSVCSAWLRGNAGGFDSMDRLGAIRGPPKRTLVASLTTLLATRPEYATA